MGGWAPGFGGGGGAWDGGGICAGVRGRQSLGHWSLSRGNNMWVDEMNDFEEGGACPFKHAH